MYIADIDQLDQYDWGGTSYAYLLYGLDDVARKNLCSYVGLYPLLMVSTQTGLNELSLLLIFCLLNMLY